MDGETDPGAEAPEGAGLMRARNLKPSLFKNELLGGADPLITILFEGLWCCADREGRLEDRPLRLCAEVFPYRRSVTERKVDGWLTWLHEHGFIVRYEVASRRFIQVNGFAKHQRPHSKEQPSEIPAVSSTQHLPRQVPAPTKVGASNGKGSGEHALNPDSGLLNPESPFLNPESSLRETRARKGANPEHQQSAAGSCDSDEHAEWEATASLYPPGAARVDWIAAEKAARQLVEEGAATWTDLRAGVSRYAKHCTATNRMVLNPLKFFTDRDKPWAQAWPTPQSSAPKGRIRTAQEIAALYPEDAA